MPDLKKLSKFLAVLLRHEPEKFGLELDEQGFTATEKVWQAIVSRYPKAYSYDDLLAVVEGDEQGKKRYEIQGETIRAMYGHSDVRPIEYEVAIPPTSLYHGTSERVLDAIQKMGLQAQARQYVHLTNNLQRAQTVGHRHGGKTIVLTIRALEAHENGILFYQPEPEHFLAKSVPAEYINPL